MSTYLLNRAILNRDALDDNQRKAMFARLGGHGGGTSYGGSASKAAGQRQKDRMAKAWKMGFGLGQSMIGGIGVAAEAKLAGAVDDLAWSAIFRRHAAQPASRATIGVLDDVARDMDRMTPVQFERAYPRVGGKYDAATQARRNDLAAQLRRDRELKRLDMHPEKFFTTGDAKLDAAARLTPNAPASSLGYFSSKSVGELARSMRQESAAYQKAKADAATHGASKKKVFRHGETLALYGNRMPPARTDEERRRRAFFASKGDGYTSRARGLLDHAGTVARKAISATRTSVLRGPNDRNPQPANGFLDWALREQRPGGPLIQDNPRNPYDTPEQWAQNLRAQYEQWLEQNPGYTLPVSLPVEVPVAGPRQTVQEIPAPAPSPTPPRQRPTPPGGPAMPIGGPARVPGDPGTRPIPRNPPDPAQRIGGPAPVRRNDAPASTPKVTASTLQRAVNHIRTW